MSENRSAHYTLKGYQYQFDRSILAILRSDDSAPVTLEGIEDIDTPTELIQCKYHETQRYARSKIRKPIGEFLRHFASAANRPNYALYIHFAEGSPPDPIELKELLAILSHTRSDFALSDEELRCFLQNHLKIEIGPSLESQRLIVCDLLGQALSCTDDEVQLYYYSNAVYEVARLSRLSCREQRTITRQAFLRAINRKCILLSVWLAQLKSTTDYVQFIRRTIRTERALSPTKEKFLSVAPSILSRESDDAVAAFCADIVDFHYKPGQALRNTKPFTIILDCGVNRMKSIKRSLLRKSVRINDGFDEIEFQPDRFSEPPIVNLAMSAAGRATERIARSSYSIRVIERATYERCSSVLPFADTFISAGTELFALSVPEQCSQYLYVPDATGLNTLKQILL